MRILGGFLVGLLVGSVLVGVALGQQRLADWQSAGRGGLARLELPKDGVVCYGFTGFGASITNLSCVKVQ